MTALVKLYAAGQPDGPGRGFHLLMEAALQAPSFLYRTELGQRGRQRPRAGAADAARAGQRRCRSCSWRARPMTPCGPGPRTAP